MRISSRSWCLVLLAAQLCCFAAGAAALKANAKLAPRSAFPLAPAQPSTTDAAAAWPGAYTGGPEASIWRRPVILLVGDSITQMGSNEYDGYPGWVAHMQAHYNRKADIVNRGFGGFNTKTMLYALPEVLDMLSKQQIALSIVWLGANDAAVPDGPDARAHIPLADYQTNLQTIVQKLLDGGSERVLLVTPSPVYDGAPQALPTGESVLPRNFKTTAQYADAARKVAAAFPGGGKVFLADAFESFTQQADWATRLMAPDGLHLSRAGNDHVWNMMYNAINDKMQLTSNNLPIHHPDWWWVDFANAADQAAAEQAAYRSVHRTGGGAAAAAVRATPVPQQQQPSATTPTLQQQRAERGVFKRLVTPAKRVERAD